MPPLPQHGEVPRDPLSVLHVGARGGASADELNRLLAGTRGGGSRFEHLAARVTLAVGRPASFGLAVGGVVLWAALGPMFRFSENWQLVINTGTTIVTFLMVFLIQQSQNKDSIALHLKLDELLAATRGASNGLIAVEDLDERQLRRLASHYQQLADQACARHTDDGAARD